MAGFGISGYNFGQLGSYGNLAWILPLSALVTLFLSFAGDQNIARAAAAFTGMVPFILVYMALEATNAPFQLVSIGAYLACLVGIGMLIYAIFAEYVLGGQA